MRRVAHPILVYGFSLPPWPRPRSGRSSSVPDFEDAPARRDAAAFCRCSGALDRVALIMVERLAAGRARQDTFCDLAAAVVHDPDGGPLGRRPAVAPLAHGRKDGEQVGAL